MVELSNSALEVWGAFGFVVIVMIWVILYFKSEKEEERTHYRSEIKETREQFLAHQREQLQISRETNKVIEGLKILIENKIE